MWKNVYKYIRVYGIGLQGGDEKKAYVTNEVVGMRAFEFFQEFSFNTIVTWRIFDTNFINFRNVAIFQKHFFFSQEQNFCGGKSWNFKNIPFLKVKIAKLITIVQGMFETHVCWIIN